MTTPRFLRCAATCAVLLTGVFSAGCAPSASDTQTSASATPPSGLDSVAVTFDLDGEVRTLSGSIAGGVRSCADDGDVTVATKTPPDAGVQVFFDPDDAGRTRVAAWIVGDVAVQFLGEGTVNRTDHENGYGGTDIVGRASVVPVEPGGAARISEFDMAQGKQVDATMTFALACPVD